jgi:hypothetical protein
MSTRSWRVTITLLREFEASIAVEADSQAAADRMALAAFDEGARGQGLPGGLSLGLPPPWREHECSDGDPEISLRFRCVDCGKDTSGSGEYYAVANEVWAASGLAPDDGMLCLADLERRIGRLLTPDDFTALWPSREAWRAHLAARSNAVSAAAQIELPLDENAIDEATE